jgi:Toprim-like
MAGILPPAATLLLTARHKERTAVPCAEMASSVRTPVQRSSAGKSGWREQLVGARLVPDTATAVYLAARGLSMQIAEVAGARYAPAFFGRPAIAFPLRAPDRAIVAVHGHFVDGKQPKARTSGPRQAGVFTTTGHFESRRVAVTESPIDALSLAQLGLPAIALCDRSWPGWLPKVLFGREVHLAFKADRAADSVADELGDILSRVGVTWQLLRPSGHKDWNAALLAGDAAISGVFR